MYRKLKISLFSLIVLVLPFFSILPIRALEPSGNYLIVNGGTIRSQSDNQTQPTSFYFDILIKPYNVSGQRQILTITDSLSSEAAYQIGINGGSLSFIQRYGSSAYRLITAGNLVTNTWQRIRVIVDANSTELFIDNTNVFSGNGISNLKKINGQITLGGNYYGEMDQFSLLVNNVLFMQWNFDQQRGETTVNDTSGNSINGILTGGDAKIHFYGPLPTPTKFILPTLPSIRRITFPGFPTHTPDNNNIPTATPVPTGNQNTDGWNRFERPIFPR